MSPRGVPVPHHDLGLERVDWVCGDPSRDQRPRACAPAVRRGATTERPKRRAERLPREPARVQTGRLHARSRVRTSAKVNATGRGRIAPRPTGAASTRERRDEGGPSRPPPSSSPGRSGLHRRAHPALALRPLGRDEARVRPGESARDDSREMPSSGRSRDAGRSGRGRGSRGSRSSSGGSRPTRSSVCLTRSATSITSSKPTSSEGSRSKMTQSGRAGGRPARSRRSGRCSPC